MNNSDTPDIQLIANIVVEDDEGRVLLVKYDPDSDRWWLPGDDLETYQHPDDRAKQLLDGLAGLTWSDLSMVFIESFRGRSGWHVMFNYRAKGSGEPLGDLTTGWFPPEQLPRTMHGKWERGVVDTVVHGSTSRHNL